MFDKNAVMDIPCPGCSHLRKLTISEIENNHTFTCEGCKNQVTIDGTKYSEGLQKAEQLAINSLNNAFKGFNLK